MYNMKIKKNADDRLSSLKFMIRDISRTIFHYKMLVIPYCQVQPNIRHEIFVVFLCGFKTMENKCQK